VRGWDVTQQEQMLALQHVVQQCGTTLFQWRQAHTLACDGVHGDRPWRSRSCPRPTKISCSSITLCALKLEFQAAC
jgi:hypothetical protein